MKHQIPTYEMFQFEMNSAHATIDAKSHIRGIGTDVAIVSSMVSAVSYR